MTAYDYGFRIYNPGIARFLSVDPLTKGYPWNSTYAFAENDVIRSIDLDGLEKCVVVTSPYNAKRIKALIKKKDFQKIKDIIDYSASNGWVDDQGQPSDYIHRKAEEIYGKGSNKLPIGVSTYIFDDLLIDESLVEKYGDIDDHGGYMSIYHYNYEIDDYEELGILPISKMNGFAESKDFILNDEFWQVNPTYNKYDIGEEFANRYLLFGRDLSIEKILDKLGAKGISLPFDAGSVLGDKLRFAIEGRLRTAGDGSSIVVPMMESGKRVGYIHMQYNINERGEERFKSRGVKWEKDQILDGKIK